MQSNFHISEIFYSIQGESSYAGLPCVFIRLSGCNLRCNYCDAEFTWEEGEKRSLESILQAVEDFPCSLVEITGGEPLFHKDCVQLIQKLITAGKTVLVETNGSIAIDRVPHQAVTIIDVKCPDSGSAGSFHPDNIKHIRQRLSKSQGTSEMKFVLSSKNDYHWAKEFCTEHSLTGKLPIHFSPVHNRVSPRNLSEWLMKDGLNIRLQLQLHTILWPSISRGI